MNKLMIAALLTVVFALTPAWAVKVKTLYDVEISVASQAADARADAIREGMQEVLVRLTGDQDICDSKQMQIVLDKADYYVQEFSYSAPKVSSATYTLNIKYSEPDVKRLLRKSGLRSWSEARPLVLVWLAMSNNKHEVDILGVETANEVLEKFKKQGQRYGLPLIFPVMDVTDMDKITSANVTAVAMPELKSASKRYQPDALLVGKMEQGADVYEAHWNLVWKDKVWEWNTTGPTQEKAIADVLRNVSEVLSQRPDVKRVSPALSQS